MSRNNNTSRNSSNNRTDSTRSSGSRRGSHSSRRGSDVSSFPVEQGIICTLKDNFGFIHCAERPDDIFFHFSEVNNCHPDELRIDTEVEFRVGTSPSDDTKLAAFQVNALPSGTVVWETEDEPGRIYQGVVEKQVRSDEGRGCGGGNNSFDTDGSIRVVVVPEVDTPESDKGSKSGPLVRLRVGEYTGEKVNNGGTAQSANQNVNPRLFRGDFVEFRILTDRRTKQKYARFIKLVHSEKEQKAVEREKILLDNAVPEQGIITSLNNGFGFIRSNKRREDVYFHYSQVIVPEDEKLASENGIAEFSAQKEATEFQLKKGQEVKFLVVTITESQNLNKGSNHSTSSNAKVSARQVEVLPKGSVIFHIDVAKGVKGVVAMVPHPPTPNVRGDDSKEGRIRLLEPITLDDPEEENGSYIVNEVLLHYSDAPGGMFTYQNHRNQSVSALWIQEGDTLLFDIINETVDRSFRAIPTWHTVELGGSIKEPMKEEMESNNAKPCIRMLALSLVGRAEGVLHTMKNDYGFIHFSERPVDVHFRFYDILPDVLQEDIRKYMGIEGPVKVEPGSAAQFDICAHGIITGVNSRTRRKGNSPLERERENLRGTRLLILPPSAIVVDTLIATGIKGVIKCSDPKQTYAGAIDLDEEVRRMSLEDRHPLVAQMIDSFLLESSTPCGRKVLVYRDTLSMKDDEIVVELAKLKGNGLLECSHIPIPGITPHPGRLCIRRVDKVEDEELRKEEPNGDAPKKAKKAQKDIKSIRFDKSSLIDDLKEDVPPAPGDIVSCDLVQSRRSGNVLVRNMKIVERNMTEDIATEIIGSQASGIGVVKDVVLKRNFGFVSVLDDNGVRTELLFFHLPKDRKGGGLRKGDEVKFDIAMEGAKRIATNLKKVPKGTIPATVSKNACLGYVLMEPSHTSLSETPQRKLLNARSGGLEKANSRWIDGRDDPKKSSQHDMPEEGCILLIEDKAGLFQRNNLKKANKKRSGSMDSHDTFDDMLTDDGKSVDGKSIESLDGFSISDGELSSDASSDDDTPANNGIVKLFSHLGYKNGSIYGFGAGNSLDASTSPRRGDLVSFVKGRKRNTACDIRVEGRQKATLQQGRLEEIRRVYTEDGKNKGTAKFIARTEKEDVYEIDLGEVVSCNAKVLKEKELVEGILYDGKIYGVCRMSDLYLSSKLGTSHKERPKLNLSVKKNRGGTIMAQSMNSKGPDGTKGFKPGWTRRISQYSVHSGDNS